MIFNSEIVKRIINPNTITAYPQKDLFHLVQWSYMKITSWGNRWRCI